MCARPRVSLLNTGRLGEAGWWTWGRGGCQCGSGGRGRARNGVAVAGGRQRGLIGRPEVSAGDIHASAWARYAGKWGQKVSEGGE